MRQRGTPACTPPTHTKPGRARLRVLRKQGPASPHVSGQRGRTGRPQPCACSAFCPHPQGTYQDTGPQDLLWGPAGAPEEAASPPRGAAGPPQGRFGLTGPGVFSTSSHESLVEGGLPLSCPLYRSVMGLRGSTPSSSSKVSSSLMETTSQRATCLQCDPEDT